MNEEATESGIKSPIDHVDEEAAWSDAFIAAVDAHDHLQSAQDAATKRRADGTWEPGHEDLEQFLLNRANSPFSIEDEAKTIAQSWRAKHNIRPEVADVYEAEAAAEHEWKHAMMAASVAEIYKHANAKELAEAAKLATQRYRAAPRRDRLVVPTRDKAAK